MWAVILTTLRGAGSRIVLGHSVSRNGNTRHLPNFAPQGVMCHAIDRCRTVHVAAAEIFTFSL